MVRHVFRIALFKAAKRPTAEERGEHFLLIVGQSVALGFHHACRERFVDSFWRHLAHRVRCRSLRYGRISMAAHAVRLKCSDARFRARAEIRACRSRSLLRLCPRRPAPCQTRTQECDSNDVQISVHWSDSFSLDFLVFAALPCTLQLSYPGVLFHAEQGSAAHGLALLIADPAPGGIQMILQSRSPHFDPPDLAVFDLERLGDFQARWPIEILHRYILAVGEVDRLNGAILIEDHVRPDDSALFINDRKTPVMNPSDYCIVATLELRNAAQRKSVERSVRRQRRIVRRMNSVFYA